MLKLIHQEVLGVFMVLYFNPYLRKLETDILKSEYIDLIDPILIKEFKKAINSITPEYWQEIAVLFKNNINYVYSIDEQMVFTIIATKMGIEFLSKDPEYCGELISILALLKKSPLNYVKYTKLLLSEPLYSCIVNIITKSRTFSYHEFLEIIFSRNLETPEMSEESYNTLIKSLYKIQEKVYYIFILPEDSLLTIFKKIVSFMKNANQEQLQFSKQSFSTLSILLDIIKSNNEELINKAKEDLLAIDQNNTTSKKIIQEVLTYLSKLNLSQNIIRRRYHA